MTPPALSEICGTAPLFDEGTICPPRYLTEDNLNPHSTWFNLDGVALDQKASVRLEAMVWSIRHHCRFGLFTFATPFNSHHFGTG